MLVGLFVPLFKGHDAAHDSRQPVGCCAYSVPRRLGPRPGLHRKWQIQRKSWAPVLLADGIHREIWRRDCGMHAFCLAAVSDTEQENGVQRHPVSTHCLSLVLSCELAVPAPLLVPTASLRRAMRHRGHRSWSGEGPRPIVPFRSRMAWLHQA